MLEADDFTLKDVNNNQGFWMNNTKSRAGQILKFS